MKECIIKVENLRKEFPGVTPIEELSTKIYRGDVISIIGPSGTGKSTFLRCINGLEKPTSGHIFINDIDITEPKCDLSRIRKQVGMVFQSFNLFDNLDVLDNVAVPQIQILGKSRDAAEHDAMEILARLGMDEKAGSFPDELSGGQKQRVAVARAIAMNPEVLMFDEPTSALDPTRTREVQNIIRLLVERGITILIVTHDMRFAREVSNRVFYMDEGGICEDGAPEQIFDNPVKEMTRKFIKHIQSIELTVDSTEFNINDFMDKLSLFAKNSSLDRKHIHMTQVMFEELVLVQLVHMRKRFSKINVSISYSQSEHWLEMVLVYGGAEYNPLEMPDKVIDEFKEYAIKESSHEYKNRKNKLVVRF